MYFEVFDLKKAKFKYSEANLFWITLSVWVAAFYFFQTDDQLKNAVKEHNTVEKMWPKQAFLWVLQSKNWKHWGCLQRLCRVEAAYWLRCQFSWSFK